MTEPKPDSPRRPRRARKLLLIFVIVLAALGVLVAFGPGWFGPMIVRARIASALRDYWNGQCDIDLIELDWTQPPSAKGISLTDQAGREVVHIGRLETRFDGWPSTRPVLRELEFHDVTIMLYVDNEQLTLPLKFPPPEPGDEPDKPSDDKAGEGSDAAPDERPDTQPNDAPDEEPDDESNPYVDLQRIAIHNLSVQLAPSQQDVPPAGLEALHQLRIEGTGSVTGDVVIAMGANGASAEPTLSGDLSLDVLEILDLRRLLGMPPVEADPSPLTLTNVRLPRIEYHHNKLDVPSFYADLGDGKLWGNVWVSLDPDDTGYGGRLRGKYLPLPEICAAWDPDQHVTYGRASAMLEVAKAPLSGIPDMELMFFLDNADLDESWILGSVLEFVGMGGNVDGGSDLRGLTRIRDGVLMIGDGGYGSHLAALYFEPGGTIDLNNRQLDLHVVHAPLRQLKKIPLIGAIAGLSEKATRLHVRGPWSKPIIAPDPVQNITKGAEDFITDVLKSGGQLRELMLAIPRALSGE